MNELTLPTLWPELRIIWVIAVVTCLAFIRDLWFSELNSFHGYIERPKKVQEVATVRQTWRELVEGLCPNGDRKRQKKKKTAVSKNQSWPSGMHQSHVVWHRASPHFCTPLHPRTHQHPLMWIYFTPLAVNYLLSVSCRRHHSKSAIQIFIPVARYSMTDSISQVLNYGATVSDRTTQIRPHYTRVWFISHLFTKNICQ